MAGAGVAGAGLLDGVEAGTLLGVGVGVGAGVALGVEVAEGAGVARVLVLEERSPAW